MISQKTLKRAISAAALLRYFPANDCDARAALGEVLVEICPDDDSLELTRGICLSLSERPGLAHFRECVLDAINAREFAQLPPPLREMRADRLRAGGAQRSDSDRPLFVPARPT